MQLSTDSSLYCDFHNVLFNIVQTLGEGYSLQKQDIFCRQKYHKDLPPDAEFLTKSYFKFFEGREYTEIKTYLIITQEPHRTQFIKYDPKKWDEFITKVAKIDNILTDSEISHRKLNTAEISEYIKRFLVFNFKKGAFSMNNMIASDEGVKIGNNVIRSFPLVDVDEVNLPVVISPYTTFQVNGQNVSTDLLNFLPSIPETDCVVYNQLVQIPSQRRLLNKLHSKSNRHGSLHGPSNEKAKLDIDNVLNILANDSSLLVNCNFNILVSCAGEKLGNVTSAIENNLYKIGITPSKTAYNQWELFIASMPGNGYAMNPDYDLFLTLAEPSLCFFFKEHLKTDEETPLTTYYTDRQGLPICIDFTGKEGKIKHTDNSNFFCIGPSGSGKSFHMDSKAFKKAYIGFKLKPPNLLMFN